MSNEDNKLSAAERDRDIAETSRILEDLAKAASDAILPEVAVADSSSPDAKGPRAEEGRTLAPVGAHGFPVDDLIVECEELKRELAIERGRVVALEQEVDELRYQLRYGK